MLKALMLSHRIADLIIEKNNGVRPPDEKMRYYDHVLIYSDYDPSFVPEIITFLEFCNQYRWITLQDNYNAVEKV